MKPSDFVAARLAELDGMAEKPKAVWLTEYTLLEWRRAPEPFCSLMEAEEINRLLAEGLRARGIEVKWRGPKELHVAFTIKGWNSEKNPGGGGIGWAVLGMRKEKDSSPSA